jgi:hypothetical protein
MTRKPSLNWKIGIAIVALAIAIAVYCLVRLYPPELLAPFQVTSELLGSHASIFGSAPSLLYTLSIGLIIGVVASTLAAGQMHCLIWIVVALGLEISQATVIAAPLAAWLADILPASVWEIVGPYWTRGVFDWFDLFATALGGAIALAILTYLPGEEIDEVHG